MNNTLQLQLTGSRLATIIQRRIGELESEVGEIQRREDALRAAGAGPSTSGPRYRGMRDVRELTRQRSALATIVDNLEPATIYAVSLADLVLLDVMDAVERC